MTRKLRSVFRKKAKSFTRAKRNRRRLRMESLEDRQLLFVFTPGNFAELITAFDDANTNGESDTIDLGGNTFTIGTVNNVGAIGNGNALPIVGSDSGNSLTIENGTIQRNTASGTPAFRILEVGSGADVTLDNVNIHNGLASDFGDGWGGGIFNSGTLAVTNSTISGNTGNNSSGGDDSFENGVGGGIFNEGSLTVTDSTISGNTANISTGGDESIGYGQGGGIAGFSNNTTLSIANSTISGNVANISSGGVESYGYGRGGGIYASYVTLSITNSTISGNTANSSSGNNTTGEGFGGGIHFNRRTTLSITNSTISGNTGDSSSDGSLSIGDGGGIFNPTLSSPGIVNNTIVAGNESTPGVPNDVIGFVGGTFVVISGSNNLIGDASSAGGLTNGVDGNIVGADPLLGPLQNNGGPTETHQLLASSPAIDAGDNALIPAGVLFDQRGAGFDRIVNGSVDIGAFEVAEAPPEEQIEDLIDQIQVEFDVPSGLENSLVAKLDSAIAVLNDSNPNNDGAAVNSLNAFANQVQAQSGKKLTVEEANALLDAVAEILALLRDE